MNHTQPRPLPYNLDAEQAVLGSLLIDNDAIPRVFAIVRADDFYREKHQWIYAALIDLHERREPADQLTITDELERHGRLGDVGGPAALAELVGRVPTAIHVEYYANIVQRTSTLRRLIAAAERISKMAYEETELEVSEIIDKAERELFAVGQHKLSGAMATLEEILGKYYDQVEELFLKRNAVGLQTGFTDLDRLLGGFQQGDLIILAARPSVGKTALALSMLESSAIKYRARVAYFSLEMGVDQIAQRLISSQTGIDAQRLRIGPIYDDDLERINFGVEVLSKTEIYVDESPVLNPLEMRAKLRRLVSERGLDLVIIDYLQLMSSGKQADNNRVQEISYISRMLKETARELKLPILALSQLSRGVESRQDKRPMLSDLRESGSIEQDSDVVMFIYRDEVYNKNTEKPNIAEIIVAKHRNGPTGSVELRFTRENAKFSNLESYFGDDDAFGPPPATLDAGVDDIIF